MSTANTAARNARAADFSADFTTASLVILDGGTTVVTHTLAGFGAPSTGVITGNAIADATIAASGTVDGATLTAGGSVYTLTVGLAGSGADVIVSGATLDYVSGGTSSISSLTVTFPA